MTEGETITIRVFSTDQKRISAYGHFGESFADVVKKILDEYEELKAREGKKGNPLEATLTPALA